MPLLPSAPSLVATCQQTMRKPLASSLTLLQSLLELEVADQEVQSIWLQSNKPSTPTKHWPSLTLVQFSRTNWRSLPIWCQSLQTPAVLRPESSCLTWPRSLRPSIQTLQASAQQILTWHQPILSSIATCPISRQTLEDFLEPLRLLPLYRTRSTPTCQV